MITKEDYQQYLICLLENLKLKIAVSLLSHRSFRANNMHLIDLKIFDGPIICSINRNQGLVYIIQRDPETTIWEQLTIDPADTFKNDKISSNNINLIDVGLYDSHTSAPQLLFACKMTSGSTKSKNKSRKSNGHRNNVNTNNNNKSTNNDNSDNNNSDHMDIDHDAKSDFWETVNRSGLLKSSNLNALFTQRYQIYPY